MADAFGLWEVRAALAEDRTADDVTTRLLGPAAQRRVTALFVAEGPLVVAGLPLAETVFRELESRAEFEPVVEEGAEAAPPCLLGAIRASACAVLGGERVALNFIQRLSGIATLTRRAVAAVAGTGARITHTRKTTPGLRALERYAVRVGGGVDNRGSLADGVLWKDNHWVLAGAEQIGLVGVIGSAARSLPVAVEVENDRQLEEALAAGVTHVLADNQSPARVAAWVRRAGPDVTIEATGGITPESARAYAEAGASLISIGALTQSAAAAAIRLDLLVGDGSNRSAAGPVRPLP